MPLTPKRVLRQFRYAMYFNGVNNYVKINDVPQLNNSLEATFIYWVYYINPSDYDLSGYIKRDYGPAIRFGRTSNGQVFINPGTHTDIYINYILNPSYWYYLALVIRCGVSWYVYVNVSYIASGTNGLPSYIETGAPWGIGATIEFGNIRYYVSGYIPYVFIYSRALSDSEIQFNYQNPDKPIRNGLVLWLQADPQYIKDIDNDGILEWIDLSGYNNHGKIYGAQLVQLIKTPSRVLKL